MERGARPGPDASGEVQRLSVQGEVAQHETRFLAVLQHRPGVRDRLRGGLLALQRSGKDWRRVGLVPVTVGWRHYGTYPPCFRERGRLRAEFAKFSGVARLLRPMRHHAGEIGYVAVDQLVLGIIGLMIASVRADDIDDGRIGPARIVHHGDAIAEAAADVQERKGRGARHAGIAIRGACDDVLLQAEDRTHLVGHPDFIDELHLRRAGIGEACRDARIHQRLE